MSTVLQMYLLYWWSMETMLFGPQGVFRCNTTSGHRDKLVARLSVGAVSKKVYFSNKYKPRLCVTCVCCRGLVDLGSPPPKE